jgi:uncharacterized protein YprB with RNaseH-like and TPR domain
VSLEKRLRYLERALQQRAVQQPGDSRREKAETRDGARSPQPDPFAPERGWEAVGEYTLRRQLHFPNVLQDSGISEFLLPPGYTPSDLLFFDTETTGLSGGAGNSAFLVGMAWIDGRVLTTEQVFLKDFPGEEEFLAVLSRRLGRHRVFVSYNGRAFDAHVLRTRFLLNRMELTLEQQTDLLYWSRRLWRRILPDCSLGTVEREILGIVRGLDVSGFEVPGIYLQYLSSGEPGRLDAVLEHNLQDVRTLADLMVSREQASEAEVLRADRAALGSFFLSRDERWGVELLKGSFASGDEGAGRALSLYYKRRGAWGEAVGLWKQMASKRRSMFAGIELAKYFEHRERDPEQALAWVRTILSWQLPLDRRHRSALSHRRQRLLEKIKRRSSIL